MAFGRLSRRNQVHNTVADQIPASHLLQGFSQQWPVFWVVIPQERFMQAALTEFSYGAERFAVSSDRLQRIASGVIHGGCGCHRRGIERLHLIGPKAVPF
jgi:hypothetical protein